MQYPLYTDSPHFKSMDDQCPVCKSDRYLNPKLRLLVSSCYHKMCVAYRTASTLLSLTSRPPHATRCESCIDRLYTLGPAPCPVCGKTLKKMTFIPQTFEDLVVEKEVAIRRKLAKESVAGVVFFITSDTLTFVWDQVQQA